MGGVGRYAVVERLYESTSVRVSRARDTRDGGLVVLKQPAWGANASGDHGRLRHEHAILRSIDSPAVVAARGIEDLSGVPALVLEDFGGESLDRILARQRLDLATTLRLGVQIADALGDVHRARVIHKDVNPSNVLVNRATQVQLIDFNIAARLPRESQGLESANRLEGTLPFISPEQTGRMSRAIDHRTDLYSLGATLYAMLVGQPPFPSGDRMEIVHAHLARRPTPPAELDPEIPAVVSDIVMKLLSKAPEDRYRTAAGLRADLAESLARLEKDGAISPFPLGRYDVLDRLQFPDRLYGRDLEFAAMQSAFERASGGAPELVLVSGYPGIGKSVLIRQLQRAVVERGGYFVFGKFDQYKKDIPYSAMLDAFRDLVRQLLAESELSLARWREALGRALGGVGQVLIDVLPEAEFLLGAQPPVPELPAAAAEIRFRNVILEFVQVFTERGCPLAIFLDDLHWADAATLDLLVPLLSDAKAGALMIIGAYRDNEAPATHPLFATVAKIEKAGRGVAQVKLGPIAREHVLEMTADALGLPRDEARPVGEIAWRKAQGNPFFTAELLKSFEREGLIWFDPEALRFRWDLDRLEGAPLAENVVDLMTARVRSLGARAQAALQLAACIGNRFDLQTLSTVDERPIEEAALALVDAVEQGLVLPLGEAQREAASPGAVYRFLHDRVQQAVMETINEEALKPIHLQIGRLLLRSSASAPSRSDQEERLFEILNHLNMAIELVHDAGERREICQLNLTAGRRAMSAAAFASAAIYFTAGIRLLPDDPWNADHALAYALHLGLVECEFSRSGFEAAEPLFEVLLQQAPSDLELAYLGALRASLRRHAGKVRDSVRIALEALDRLGVHIELEQGKASLIASFLKTRRALGGRSPSELLELPELTDPRKKLALRILMQAGTTAYFIDSELFAVIVLRSTALSAEHGNSSHSASGYMVYGVLLGSVLGRYEEGDAFARLAIELTRRYPNQEVEAQVKNSYGIACYHWRNPATDAIPLLREATRAGLESGNLGYASYALEGIARLMLWACRDLAAFQDELTILTDGVRRCGGKESLHNMRLTRQIVLALRGATVSTKSLSSSDFDEDAYEAFAVSHEVQLFPHYLWSIKAKLLALHGHWEDALPVVMRASKRADAMLRGLIELATFHFYAALVLAAAAGSRSGLSRRAMLLRMQRSLRKLKRWAANAPFNFGHQYELAAAELCRVELDDHGAIQHYARAIALAREQDLPLDQALAEELAGGFYLSRGESFLGLSYVARARQSYERVGALAKVGLLDERYPGLAGFAAAPRGQGGATVSTSITAAASAGVLDWPSLVKASQALSGEIDRSRLLMRLMQVVFENAGAERGALVLRRDQELQIVAEVSVERGASVPEPPPRLSERDDLPAGIIQYVTRTRESVILSDAARTGDFVRDDQVARRKLKSLLCMPVLQHGEAKGALYLENNLVTSAFTAERVELLGVICAQMAISIENATLYGGLERMVRERTSELEEAQARIVRLEKVATEVKMAGGFAHEMRNTLSSAKILLTTLARAHGEGDGRTLPEDNIDVLQGVSRRVGDELSRESLAQVTGALQRVSDNERRILRVVSGVEKAVSRALSITDRILTYAQLGTANPGNAPVLLRPLVEATLAGLSADLATHGVEVELAIAPESEIVAGGMHVEAMMRNLLLNARDALVEKRDPGERKLRIEFREGEDGHLLEVEDTGVGISPEDQKSMFEPFFSTKPSARIGLGLPTVQRIVEMYQGTVRVESELGRGTSVRIRLPRRA